MTRTETCTLVAPARRKRQSSLVLYLSGGSTCESDNDAISVVSLSESPEASSSKVKLAVTPIIVNGKLVVGGAKRYQCTFAGCAKSYKKPARLEEHERTHTGERPFVCSTCQKTYYRDAHLQAHMRSHQADSSRPFACSHDGCEKKFWTSQHLKRHEDVHSGEKPFKCTEVGCDQSFSKHNQLRAHFTVVHCPPGTKNLRCEHDGCTKSFATGQKLKAHAKTHDEHRYTCSQTTCLQEDTQEFFQTWSALQAHTRSAHPPTCPYAPCNGKTFSQHKGFRAHLKLHEQREIEEVLVYGGDAGDADGRPIKRRRGGEVGRDWKCEEEGCEKDFKSKNALETHVKVAHLRRRDFVCSVEGCRARFGYKHLLQRHTARVHEHVVNTHTTNASTNLIDQLTGKAYQDRTRRKNALVCPYPGALSTLLAPMSATPPSPSTSTSRRLSEERTNTPRVCAFAFTRAYDLRRHLLSAHGLEVDREEAVALAATLRRRNHGSR